MSDELDELVGAARSLDDEPPSGAQKRMWAAIVAAPALAPAAATATTGLGLTAKLVLGLVGVGTVGGLVTAGVIATRPPSPPPEPEPVATVTATAAPLVEPETTAAAKPDPELVESTAPEVVDPVVDLAPAKPRRAKRKPEPTPDAGSLVEETKLLRQARLALRNDNPKAALAKIRAHGKRFPDGELVDLRMALEVQALCDAGRRKQADGARKRFLARYPKSPLSKRVREGCVDTPKP